MNWSFQPCYWLKGLKEENWGLRWASEEHQAEEEDEEGEKRRGEERIGGRATCSSKALRMKGREKRREKRLRVGNLRRTDEGQQKRLQVRDQRGEFRILWSLPPGSHSATRAEWVVKIQKYRRIDRQDLNQTSEIREQDCESYVLVCRREVRKHPRVFHLFLLHSLFTFGSSEKRLMSNVLYSFMSINLSATFNRRRIEWIDLQGFLLTCFPFLWSPPPVLPSFATYIHRIQAITLFLRIEFQAFKNFQLRYPVKLCGSPFGEKNGRGFPCWLDRDPHLINLLSFYFASPIHLLWSFLCFFIASSLFVFPSVESRNHSTTILK